MILTNKFLFKTLGIALLISIGLYQLRIQVRHNKELVKFFYENSVSGKLVLIEDVSGGFVKIGLDNGKEFTFCPSRNRITFSSFVSVGDSLYKSEFSDQVIVYKNGKEFTFYSLKE